MNKNHGIVRFLAFLFSPEYRQKFGTTKRAERTINQIAVMQEVTKPQAFALIWNHIPPGYRPLIRKYKP